LAVITPDPAVVQYKITVSVEKPHLLSIPILWLKRNLLTMVKDEDEMSQDTLTNERLVAQDGHGDANH
jgi:hypothetical protein